jgi:hypothetical protein
VNESITPRGNRKKSPLKRENPDIAVQPHYVYEYEPSNMVYAYNSELWQWRRVVQWDRYINDPLEKNKGTHDNLI